MAQQSPSLPANVARHPWGLARAGQAQQEIAGRYHCTDLLVRGADLSTTPIKPWSIRRRSHDL